MPQDYWSHVRTEMYLMQNAHELTDAEMMIHFQAMMAEAIDRLYVKGLYEAIPQERPHAAVPS